MAHFREFLEKNTIFNEHPVPKAESAVQKEIILWMFSFDDADRLE